MTADLFTGTHRSQMPLTSDYVFRTVFGRDREDSRAALIEILNIILDRRNDPRTSDRLPQSHCPLWRQTGQFFIAARCRL